MKDITGQRNGRLVAVKPLYKDKHGAWHWECKCDCGNTSVVCIGNFKPNKIRSCGCLISENAQKQIKNIQKLRTNYVKKVDSLVGQSFGCLKVIDLPETSESFNYYECECVCGKHIIVNRKDLINGKKTSCGCQIVKNEYDFTSDTCIGYTLDNQIFLVDIDKFDYIKNYLWSIDSEGYVVCHANKIKLHRLVMGFPDGKDIDHVHGKESRFDNRSCNLRPCTEAENARNRPPHKNNKLGVKGVSQIGESKYRVEIQFQHERIQIGVFDTLKKAADAYDKKAKELFGEYAWLNNYEDKEESK